MRLAGNKGIAINDEVIAQLTYSVICALERKKLGNLPRHIYKQIVTEKKAKNFSYKSSTDQKRELFSYLDIGFFWTFVSHTSFTDKLFVEVLKKFKKENPVSALKVMAEHGVAITSDLDYSFFLQQMSNVFTSEEYRRNMQLARIGRTTKKWSNKFNPSGEKEEIEEEAIQLSNLIGVILREYKHLPSYTGVTENEYKILNYLYQRKGKYIEVDYIWKYFSGDIPQRKISFSLNKLVKNLLIQKHPDWNKKQYTITKSGFRVIHSFRDVIIKSINF